MGYQYKLVGAPERGQRRRGARSGSERIAAAMQDLVAQHAQEGWEYLRTDTIPVVERVGLLGARRERLRAVMVFRRALRQAGAERQGSLDELALLDEIDEVRPRRALPETAREPALHAPAPRAPLPETGEARPAPVGEVGVERGEARRLPPRPAELRAEPRMGAAMRAPAREPAPHEPDDHAETEDAERMRRANPRDLSDIREALRKLDR
ncbi:MAG: hypothetical protein AAF675_14670 [Pseudomonadota bacterium]